MLDLRSQYGVAFCAIHHKHRQDGTLGSVQWEAFCDTIMLLSRSPNGERFVKTVQRAGADMESSRLERDENTGQITIVESKLMSDQRAAEQRILRYASMLDDRQQEKSWPGIADASTPSGDQPSMGS